jgi:predicted choloylglycine hydrolase
LREKYHQVQSQEYFSQHCEQVFSFIYIDVDEFNPWYKVIKTEYPKIIRKYKGLEPTKKDTSTKLTDDFSNKMFKW